MRRREIGLNRKRPLKDFNGMLVVAGLRKRAAEGVEQLETIRTNPQRGLERFDRRLESCEFHQRQAEVRVGIEQIRLQDQGSPIDLDGVGDSPERRQRGTQAGVILGGGGIERDGAADEIQGRLALAHLAGQNAQKMQNLRAVRIGQKNLAINSLGLAQPPGLVMLDRQVQGLLKIHG